MNLFILGVIGPMQAIILLVIPLLIIVLIVRLISKNSKNKAKADVLQKIVDNSHKDKESSIDKLEKLNKLRESGALTQAEFETEKKKII